MKRPILVVDDDPKIVSLVRMYLERDGYRVVTAADGLSALSAIEDAMPCLVVLDLMLPELDGVAIMRRVREQSDTPIVMVSARGSTADRVYGIDEGADDYLAKPFSPAELMARIKAVLRRENRGQERLQGVRSLGDLTVDLDRMQVRRGDQTIPLTPAEFRLLAALVAADGRVLTRQALLDALYGHAVGSGDERTVDVHIGRIRKKLDEAAVSPRYIDCVRGAGYRAKAA